MKRQAVLALWALLAALVSWRFAGKATDDVFITYRYAWNLAAGEGFVFNPGERVFGVTDPGVGLLLGALHSASGVPVPVLGTLLTAAALLGIAASLLSGGAGRGRLPETAVAGTLLVVAPYLWIGQGSGPVVALALLLAAARLAERWPLAAGIVAGLAFWFRPDAALGAGLLGLLLWRERRRLPVAFAAGALGVGLAGCLAAWAWFGTVVPNTLKAKQQFAALNPAVWTGLSGFWGRAWQVFRFHAGPLAAGLLALGLAGQVPLFRGSGRAGRLLVLYAAGLAVAYSLLRVPFFLWYTAPMAIAVLYGACWLGGWGLRRLAGRRPALPAAIAAGLALALVAGSWLGGSWRWWRERQAGDWRLAAYRQAGEWIRESSRPGEDVAMEEIGILAYYSERPVQDLVGLVTPRSLPYTALGDFLGAFLAKPTDLVVFHTFARRGGTRPIVSRPWFGRAYGEVKRFDFPELGGAIVVYRRIPGGRIPPARPPRARPRGGGAVQAQREAKDRAANSSPGK